MKFNGKTMFLVSNDKTPGRLIRLGQEGIFFPPDFICRRLLITKNKRTLIRFCKQNTLF